MSGTCDRAKRYCKLHQRMPASFRYLANSGNRGDSPANCRTLFAIGDIGSEQGIKPD